MIDLEFFTSDRNLGVVKATVHKTGKLGFSSGAAKLLKLDKIKFFNVGVNRADINDSNLYIVPLEKETDKSFKVSKAGQYYYILIKNILAELKIDYKNESVIYNIEQVNQQENTIYKLMRRIKK